MLSALMAKLDELLVDAATLVETGKSNQMSLTLVTGGAVVTGRLVPERCGGSGSRRCWRTPIAWESSPRLHRTHPEGRVAHPSALPPGADPSGHGGDPGDGRDVPRLDRGRERLDHGRLQPLRALTPYRVTNHLPGPGERCSWSAGFTRLDAHVDALRLVPPIDKAVVPWHGHRRRLAPGRSGCPRPMFIPQPPMIRRLSGCGPVRRARLIPCCVPGVKNRSNDPCG